MSRRKCPEWHEIRALRRRGRDFRESQTGPAADGDDDVPVHEEFGDGALVGRAEGADGDVFRRGLTAGGLVLSLAGDVGHDLVGRVGD